MLSTPRALSAVNNPVIRTPAKNQLLPLNQLIIFIESRNNPTASDTKYRNLWFADDRRHDAAANRADVRDGEAGATEIARRQFASTGLFGQHAQLLCNLRDAEVLHVAQDWDQETRGSVDCYTEVVRAAVCERGLLGVGGGV